MEFFIEPDVLQGRNSLYNVPTLGVNKEDNQLLLQKINIGGGTRRELASANEHQ